MKISLLLLFAFTLWADSWSVVYISKNIKLSKNDIKSIYFKTMKQKDGHKIVALNLYSSNPARIAFLHKVLNSDLDAWDKYYDELYFRGIKSPLVLKSEESMIEFLYKVDGAVGYIPSKKVDVNFTELMRFEI